MAGRRQHGEGSVFRRSRDGRWVARADLGWRDGRRDQRLFVAATPEEAIARRAKFLTDRAGGFTAPRGRSVTVAQWLESWLASADLAETTLPGYRTNISLYIVPAIGHIRLDKLDGEPIRAMYAQLRRRGLAAATVVKTHAILRSALRAAVPGRIPRNPCDGITLKGGEEQEIVPPEEAEVLALAAAAEGRRNAARWKTGLTMGLRQGETLGLLWPLIDLDKAAMSVQWQLKRLPWQHGCEDPQACGEGRHRRPCPRPCPKVRRSGRPHACVTPGDPRCCPPGCARHASCCPRRTGGGLVLKRPKSAASRAVIPMPAQMVAALRAHQVVQEAERATMGAEWTGWAHDCPRRPRPREIVCPGCRKPMDAGALVFADRFGRPVDYRRDYGEWCELLEEAGLPHYRVHDQRHFTATYLLSLKVDVAVVQTILRHADVRTTRAYQHVALAMAAEAMDVAGARLWGPVDDTAR